MAETATTDAGLTDTVSADAGMVEVRPQVFPEPGQWHHFWSLVMTLTRGELKQRYFGSMLGYAWTLLRPLLLFAVLYVVFTEFIFRGVGAQDYPVVLLTSLVLWTYFSETTAIAVNSLVTRENLLRKIRFPRFAIPLSIGMTTGFHFVLNLLVVLVFILASGVEPRWSWLQAPFLIALLIMFTMGLSLFLSTTYVKLRDMGSIWEVFSQLLFWGTPIIWVIEFVKNETIRAVLASNPLATILIQMRQAVIDPDAPTAVDALGGDPLMLLIPFTIFAAVCGAGLWLFVRLSPGLAEDL